MMGMFDKLKGLLGSNKDKVPDGVDRATDVVDDKTGGKHTEHLDKVDEAAAKFAESDSDSGTGDQTP